MSECCERSFENLWTFAGVSMQKLTDDLTVILHYIFQSGLNQYWQGLKKIGAMSFVPLWMPLWTTPWNILEMGVIRLGDSPGVCILPGKMFPNEIR